MKWQEFNIVNMFMFTVILSFLLGRSVCCHSLLHSVFYPRPFESFSGKLTSAFCITCPLELFNCNYILKHFIWVDSAKHCSFRRFRFDWLTFRKGLEGTHDTKHLQPFHPRPKTEAGRKDFQYQGSGSLEQFGLAFKHYRAYSQRELFQVRYNPDR